MPGVSTEQIEQAKQWDLLSYLQAYEPQELQRSGPREYRTVTHDSLVISNGRWHWCSRSIGGKTALDYLIHVQGMGSRKRCRGYAIAGPPPFFPSR